MYNEIVQTENGIQDVYNSVTKFCILIKVGKWYNLVLK